MACVVSLVSWHVLYHWYHGMFCIIGIMACFVDDVLWGGNTEFETIINKLKQLFRISTELQQTFEYIRIKLEQIQTFLSLSPRRITSTAYLQLL